MSNFKHCEPFASARREIAQNSPGRTENSAIAITPNEGCRTRNGTTLLEYFDRNRRLDFSYGLNMKTEEGKLKDKIKAHLAKLGAYYFMPVPTGYGATTLDFLICLNGKFLAIETKAKGKKPTKRQELVGQQIIQAGGTVFWCDSFEGYLLNMAAFGFIVEK